MRSAVFFLLLLCAICAPAHAADFDWINSLSITASNNDGDFRSRLSLRFRIGDAELKTVIRDSGGRGDAYMVLRLAELSQLPRTKVVKVYQRYRKAKAWGKMAKALGIKPGSKEFHALKRGHDLGDWNQASKKHRDDHSKYFTQKPRTSVKHGGGKAAHNKSRKHGL